MKLARTLMSYGRRLFAGNAAPASQVSGPLARILRPQAAYRWLLPQLAAITPQYIEMVLRGALAGDHVRAWELFDLMEDSWPRLKKNAHGLKLSACALSPMIQPWQEEGEEPTDSAKQKAALCSAALRSMRPDAAADENSLHGTLYDVLDAWLKGFGVLEVDWYSRNMGTHGQAVVPRATFWVHPVCYAWSMEGRLGLRMDAAGNVSGSGMSSTSSQPLPSGVADFPEEKFLVAIAKSKSGTALGGALLRSLAWWWCASNFSADWLLNLAQTFGIPFRWASYSPNAPQSTIDAICTMLQNMGSAGYGAFPTGTSLELKNEGMVNGKDTPQGDILDRADKQCDLLILGQTLTSEAGRGGGGGSLALGQVHQDVQEGFVQAAADFASRVIQDQLFPSILRLNFGEDSECPTLTLGTKDEEDLGSLATVIQTLAEAGDDSRIGLDWLNKTFGIPKPALDEETLRSAKPPPPPPAPAPQLPQAGEPPPALPAPAMEDPVASRLRALAMIEDPVRFTAALKALSAVAAAA